MMRIKRMTVKKSGSGRKESRMGRRKFEEDGRYEW